MKDKHPVLFTVGLLAVLELAAGTLTVAVFALFHADLARTVHGDLLGIAVTLLNFTLLSLLTQKAVDNALSGFQGKEHTEEEIAAFTEQNEAAIKAKLAASQFLRYVLMFGALLLSYFLDGYFLVYATFIPFILFRPLLIAAEYIGEKVTKHGGS